MRLLLMVEKKIAICISVQMTIEEMKDLLNLLILSKSFEFLRQLMAHLHNPVDGGGEIGSNMLNASSSNASTDFTKKDNIT